MTSLEEMSETIAGELFNFYTDYPNKILITALIFLILQMLLLAIIALILIPLVNLFLLRLNFKDQLNSFLKTEFCFIIFWIDYTSRNQ